MAASLVPSRGACSSRQRGAGSSLPGSGELGRPWPQVWPLGPERHSEMLAVRGGTVLRSVSSCVHFADKKPNPSEVRGASLFPRLHTMA